MDSILIALTMSILLLPSLYLRYMPFRHFVTPLQKKNLVISYIIWFVILFCLEVYWLQTHGLSIEQYKLTTILGFLPYVLINIICIPHHLAHHIFVMGMQCIYTMLIHTGALLVLAIPGIHYSLPQLCYLQTGIYLILFIAGFPFIRKFFDRVFLSADTINDQAYWRSTCLLPLLIVADTIYLSYGDQIVVFDMLIPRLILLPTFITLMFAFSHDVTGIEEKAHLVTNNKLLSMQLSSLKEHSRLLEISNKKMAIVRHDIRHYNRLLSTLIKDGNTKAALQFITDCDDAITITKIDNYTHNPIINAALSIYINRAEADGIPLTHEIRLPSELHVDENELAIVICNLLENAFNATRRQPLNDQGIRITIKAENRHIILSVANRYQETVPLDSAGMPVTREQGHGIGMRSLTAFKDKYDATIMCDQQNGWFKIMLYACDYDK